MKWQTHQTCYYIIPGTDNRGKKNERPIKFFTMQNDDYGGTCILTEGAGEYNTLILRESKKIANFKIQYVKEWHARELKNTFIRFVGVLP